VVELFVANEVVVSSNLITRSITLTFSIFLKGMNMTKMRNDYKVYEYRSTNEPDILQWQIRIGESSRTPEVVSTFRVYDKAIETAKQLNIDPWFYDRGQTRADRNG
jgi:hypothetical protein